VGEYEAVTSVPAEELLRSIIEGAPSGILVVRSDGEIRRVNQQVERIFGYSRDELVGKKVEVLIPQHMRAVHRQHRKAYEEHPGTRPMGLGLHILARRKDGSEFPVEIHLSPVTNERGAWTIAVVQDVTEREAHNEDRNRLVLELEMEQERQRIGMDLHDGVMQEIYATSLTLELALEDLEDDAPARQSVERAIEQLHNVTRSIRSYIFDLRPRHFTGNLPVALRDLAREFQQNSQIATNVTIEEALPQLDSGRSVALYQIAHESLSNIQKHARASTVTINLHTSRRGIALDVTDDGVGFDTKAERGQSHRGLRNMVSRTQGLGGSFKLESAPGKGASLHIEMPVGSA
jgi:PAS domain S-box-containing protein